MLPASAPPTPPHPPQPGCRPHPFAETASPRVILSPHSSHCCVRLAQLPGKQTPCARSSVQPSLLRCLGHPSLLALCLCLRVPSPLLTPIPSFLGPFVRPCVSLPRELPLWGSLKSWLLGCPATPQTQHVQGWPSPPGQLPSLSSRFPPPCHMHFTPRVPLPLLALNVAGQSSEPLSGGSSPAPRNPSVMLPLVS